MFPSFSSVLLLSTLAVRLSGLSRVAGSPDGYTRKLERDVTGPRSPPVTLSLSQRDPSSAKLKGLGASSSLLAKVRAARLRNAILSKAGGNASETPLMTYDGGSGYYATISIGNPPQNIDIDLDTGSSDLWVQKLNCQNCTTSSSEGFQDGLQTYDAAKSSTVRLTDERVSTSYAEGSTISGVLAYDTVSCAEHFPVESQAFIYVDDEVGYHGNPQGLMGLAFTELANVKQQPWWMSALEQFESPEFSAYFLRWDYGSDTGIAARQPGGELMLGGRNTSYVNGNITFTPVDSSKGKWATSLQQIILSPGNISVSVQGEDREAVPDTGTSRMSGPKSSVDAFYAGVDGAKTMKQVDPASNSSDWMIPCDTATKATFVFANNVSVALPPPVLVVPLQAGNVTFTNSTTGNTVLYCSGTLQFLPGNDGWLLGDSFLSATYTVFRKGEAGETPSVGFAPLKEVDYNAPTGTAPLVPSAFSGSAATTTATTTSRSGSASFIHANLVTIILAGALVILGVYS